MNWACDWGIIAQEKGLLAMTAIMKQLLVGTEIPIRRYSITSQLYYRARLEHWESLAKKGDIAGANQAARIRMMWLLQG